LTVARTLVRDGLAYLWLEVLGRSGWALARALRLTPESVYRAGGIGLYAAVSVALLL